MAESKDVIEIAKSWLGVKWLHGGRSKENGVDCANLLCLVYHEAGLVPLIDPNPYPPDWAFHRSEELFISWLKKAGATKIDSPKSGCVALFKYGRCFSHAGIMIDDVRIVHAYRPSGCVTISRIDQEPLEDREVLFWDLSDERKQINNR